MAGEQPVNRIDPVAPVPSLLTSARDRTDDGFGAGAGERVPMADGSTKTLHTWRTGVAWSSAACHPSSNWPLCPDPDDMREGERYEAKAEPNDRELVATAPFVIYTPMSCGWNTNGEAVAQDASDLTVLHTATGLAQALWMGDALPDVSTQPTLRRSAVDVSIGGAADLDDALALLLLAYEEASGGLGGATVHLPTALVPGALGGIAGGGRVCWPEGNFYRGPLGCIVCPGPGYPHGASVAGADGYGPLTDPGPPASYAGNDDDEAWVYVTGPVEYALDDPVVLPIEDAERRGFHRQNTFEVWAERNAIVRFDPCTTFAVLVNSTVGPVS